jgi:hypothetical protein
MLPAGTEETGKTAAKMAVAPNKFLTRNLMNAIFKII